MSKTFTLQIGDTVIHREGKKVKTLSYQKIAQEAFEEKGYKNVYQMDMKTITEFINLHKEEFMEYVEEKIRKYEEEQTKSKQEYEEACRKALEADKNKDETKK